MSTGIILGLGLITIAIIFYIMLNNLLIDDKLKASSITPSKNMKKIAIITGT